MEENKDLAEKLELSDVSDSKFIEFGIWLQNSAFATYQIDGKYEGMWHVYQPEFGYITNDELVKNWKNKVKKTENLNNTETQTLNMTVVSNNVFDFETNFITCKCEEYELYPKHLGDSGYDWCKKCNCPLGTDR